MNANPRKKHVGDCVIRAIAIATNQSWLDVYDELFLYGREEYDMMSSNSVWWMMLYDMGFEPFVLPDACPECVTVREFTKYFPVGTYIIGTGSHAVAVIDGNYYDTWDSGNTVPAYFFKVN